MHLDKALLASGRTSGMAYKGSGYGILELGLVRIIVYGVLVRDSTRSFQLAAK